MEDRDIVQCVEAKIEIGHRASPRATPTKEGMTHDWTVYVRGQDRCDMSQFVEKVVFHLHHTFSNPRRVVKKPPYYVSEVGYASFDLPIEIFFKSKKEPRKIMLNYDLFLRMYEPVSSIRLEKLTFQRPTDEFKEKLINAGGVLVLPAGETKFADLRGSPTKTVSPKIQKQPLTSKVSYPSPFPSRKRPSDSPMPSGTKHQKVRGSSSVSSERARNEEQRFQGKENNDKLVNPNISGNKDDPQKLNEETITDRRESKRKVTCNSVTEEISSLERAPNGEELSKLEELKTTLMGLTDLSVLEKVVKLIQSTGCFEIKDTFAFDLCALDSNAIRQLQSFVDPKTL